MSASDSTAGGRCPTVSVCMPCFNAETHIRCSIESVIQQTYPSLELIVVDDNSSDGSAAIVGSFVESNVTLLRSPGGSAARARNLATSAAKGRFILFLDADDLINAQHIERLVAAATLKPGTIAMGEWARFVSEPITAQFPGRKTYLSTSALEWLLIDWQDAEPMTQCGTFLIPRDVLNRAGGWDERLTLIDDFEFFARLLLASNGVTFADGARLYYRSGLSGSLSRTTSRLGAESAALSLELGTNHLLAAEDSPRTRRAAANMLQTFEHTFYPAHADLRRRLGSRIRALGGADLVPPGPPGFHRLRSVMGWKLARRLQQLAERYGLNRAARRGALA